MADEVLSQAELETLLSNLESSTVRKVSDSAGHPLPAPHTARFGAGRSPRPRDLTEADRLPAVHIAALRALHEGVGRSFSAALSAQLRTVVEVKLAWIEQVTYGEFVSRLHNPTCASVVRAAPLGAKWILDVNPNLLYGMIDRLLGGGREPGLIALRPLTDIELRLASRVTKLFLRELEQGWQRTTELSLSIDRVESNPRLVLSAPSNEVVVLVGFEARINDLRGAMTLCLPAVSLAPFAAKISRAVEKSSTPGLLEDGAQPTETDLARSTVELVVLLAETKIPTRDLHGLRVGDIIATDQNVSSPLTVTIEGHAAFHAHPGAVEGRKAVRIEEVQALAPENRADD
jgi:flagellar motor switch protein FliM